MAQHDYIIENQSGAAFRADLNNGLAAIVSQNSGTNQPSTTYAYQWWADTTTGLLKLRNAANSAWITIGTLADVNLGLATTASPTFSGTATFGGDVLLSGTGQLDLPVGTTAQRSGSPNSGMIRFNSDLTTFEGYNGTAWGAIGGGATGGGSDDIFYENGQTITTNYTLTTSKNAMTAGPVSIDAGVTVTVPAGASWVVV
jgi:hypothetical protein